jgi:hypothetical protein
MQDAPHRDGDPGPVQSPSPDGLVPYVRTAAVVGKTWSSSRLRDRIDAVIAHEIAEAKTGSHEAAEAMAAETDLPVSTGARRILRAMARRGR